MKSIMYHYITKYDKSMKYFSFLDVKNFIKQINYFKNKYQFFDCRDLFQNNLEVRNRIFLTFDDGLSCHFKYVSKILKKEKINGIFYIPTYPIIKKKILNVHKIHLILGTIGPKKSFYTLLEILKKNQNQLNKNLIKKYRNKIYLESNYEKYSLSFKSYLNYFIKKDFREVILKKIFNSIFGNNENKLANSFYLKENEIKNMTKDGLIIGSHSFSHKLFSEMSIKSAKSEIKKSFDFIDQFTPLRTFSYPYGGFHTFNRNTVKILKDNKVSFSMNVESKDIKKIDLKKYRQSLPRYDCNEFIYGKIKKIKQI